MKTNYMKIIVLLAVLLCFSCGEEQEHVETLIDVEGGTKSLHPEDFDTNWENIKEIKLHNGNIVKLPWDPEATSDFPYELAKDIKKINGWEFMSTSNIEKDQNYLIFYNKYRGILKVFYYHLGNQITNNTMWYFFDQANLGLLNQGQYFTIPMNTQAQSNVAVGTVSRLSTLSVSKGWNCFFIPLTYTGKSGFLDISPVTLNLSTFDFEGNYTNKISGTIVEKHTTNPVAEAAGSVVKATGNAAEKYVKETASKEVESKKGIIKALPSVLSSIVKGGVTELVKGGLNALFGSFIGSFEKDNPTIQNVELTTTGHFKAEGTITSPGSGIAPPLNGIKADNLGMWNLSEPPKITAAVDKVMIKPNLPYSTPPLQRESYTEYNEIYFNTEYDVEVNPTIANDVSVNISHDIVFLKGPEWDEYFKKYYSLNKRIRGGAEYVSFAFTLDQYGLFNPSLLQDNSIDDGNNKNSVELVPYFKTLASRKGFYTISPENYRTKEDFEIFMRDFLSKNSYTYSTYRTSYKKLPSELKTHTIKGSPGIYPGNIAVNITVMLTVKATGEEIVSSRTFLPEYEFVYE